MILWVAHVPDGKVRGFNRCGDYSYGIYIYAWPIQQAVIAAFPQCSVPVHIAASFGTTLLFAVLSWRYIEHPALGLKSKIFKPCTPAAEGAPVVS